MRKTKEQRRLGRIQQKLQRTASFAAALASHALHGMPKATEEEIQRRFAICRTCEHFSGHSCRVCNCSVNAQSYLLNKLAWADQKCPDFPARW